MALEFGLRYVYARKLRNALKSGDFRILHADGYQNGYGENGVEYVCEYHNRQFFLSQSRTEEPSDAAHFEMVLRDPKEVSTTVPLIWPNRRGQPGLYIEVWSFGRWYKFHTPLRKGFNDEFALLVERAMAEGAWPMPLANRSSRQPYFRK
jgi:hypothetical protein